MLRSRDSLPLRCWGAAAALLAAACGQLTTPDLQHGAVVGQIPSAAAGAYAYLLGSPGVFAEAAPDGTFRLDGVPIGGSAVVMYDGRAAAEAVPVEVAGASVTDAGPGRPLRPAGAILVAASPLGGTAPTGLTFSVEGTPLRGVSGESGAALLFPLPAGVFAVVGTQPGFRDARAEVPVGEGVSAALELALEVESEGSLRGCAACGCEHGLACDPGDGRCYQCVTDADCGPGGACTASHQCSLPAGSGSLCGACTSASDCQAPSAACANPTGAVLAGYCTRSCSGTQDCPSGFDCHANACTVEASCLATVATYGATCSEDENCRAALKDGKCFPPDRQDGTAGYCSARVQAGCPPGFADDPAGSGYCARSP